MGFLEFLCYWVIIGMSSFLIQCFLYFKGPTNMIACYLTHKPSQKNALFVYNNFHNRMYLFVISRLIGASILAPLAVIDLIIDFITFSVFHDPSKFTFVKNEEEKNEHSTDKKN